MHAVRSKTKSRDVGMRQLQIVKRDLIVLGDAARYRTERRDIVLGLCRPERGIIGPPPRADEKRDGAPVHEHAKTVEDFVVILFERRHVLRRRAVGAHVVGPVIVKRKTRIRRLEFLIELGAPVPHEPCGRHPHDRDGRIPVERIKRRLKRRYGILDLQAVEVVSRVLRTAGRKTVHKNRPRRKMRIADFNKTLVVS